MAKKGAIANARLRTHQKKGAIANVKLRATSQKKGAIARARLVASGTFTINGGNDIVGVEPFTQIALQGLSATTGVTYVWSQDPTDAYQVAFVAPEPDNGSLRYILTPGTPSGTVLHLILNGSKSGVNAPTDTVNITVNAHGGLWEQTSPGVWVAMGVV
jgi:hypothetical protein